MAAQGYQPPDGHSTWAGCNGQRAWLSTWALSNNVLMIGRGDAPKDLDHDQKGTSLHGKLFALVRAEGLIKPALEEAKDPGAFVSPVSRRLCSPSGTTSSGRSRFALPFIRPPDACCRRAISFPNMFGSSRYSCNMRSMSAKSTTIGGCMMGRAIKP